MLLYAGIDEAGYGPMFGPLCVACTAFVLPDDDPARGAPDLWKRLQGAVCRGRRDGRNRIAVDDSKRLKGTTGARAHPLTHLERAVLAFDRAGGSAATTTDVGLLNRVGATVPDQPWYASCTELPVGQSEAELRITTSRLHRVMERAGVRCELIRCEAINAGEFNRQVVAMGSKASVNFCSAMRLADAVWRRWADAHPRIIVDRQGGRTMYRDELQQVFPEASIQILAEGEGLSRYRLTRSGHSLTMSFVKEAESAHLPVALASMTAKYVRELLMLRLNRFFTAELPDLKPTAGYVQDGRRFLRDIEPVITRLGVSRTSLIRSV